MKLSCKTIKIIHPLKKGDTMRIDHAKQPKLTLVGAGPGDPDLITLKGIKAIKSANVILYDALLDNALLDYAKSDAIKVYVGKRGGKNYKSQAEINQLMVEMAFEYGHVVRLKGGDPFVFGRGHEELDYAKAFGLETAVVPGISSIIAVPELQEIPVTKRGRAESFWVITGTTKEGRLSKDLNLAAQSTATVIVLMGMKKLPEIVRLYKKIGRAEAPIAIIQNGSNKNEKIGIGNIASIEEIVKEKQLGSPAIIVIGDVVLEHPSQLESIAIQAVSDKI